MIDGFGSCGVIAAPAGHWRAASAGRRIDEEGDRPRDGPRRACGDQNARKRPGCAKRTKALPAATKTHGSAADLRSFLAFGSISRPNARKRRDERSLTCVLAIRGALFGAKWSFAFRVDAGEGDPVEAIQDRFGIPVDRVGVSRTAG